MCTQWSQAITSIAIPLIRSIWSDMWTISPSPLLQQQLVVMWRRFLLPERGEYYSVNFFLPKKYFGPTWNDGTWNTFNLCYFNEKTQKMKLLEYLHCCMIFQVCCVGHGDQLLQPEKPCGRFRVNFYLLKTKWNFCFRQNPWLGKKLSFKLLSIHKIFLSDSPLKMVSQFSNSI